MKNVLEGANYHYGAGIYGKVKLVNCLVSENSNSGAGGGICTTTPVTLINCTVVSNSASRGGALFGTGTIINSTIALNSSSVNSGGGGIYLQYGAALTIKNSIIYNNTAASNDGDLYIEGTPIQVKNTIFKNVYIATDCSFDQNEVYIGTIDPLLEALADNGGTTYTCALQTGSPAIDGGLTGDDDIPDTDQRGYMANGIRDIGAFEYDGLVEAPHTYSTIYVNHAATGTNTGTSWANAYTSLQSALDAATSGKQIWIAKGTYKPSSAYGFGDATARYYHFEMKEGVEIYGGFAGIEASIDERTNFKAGGANETILSGDLNDDDVINGSGTTLAITGNSDNCYHVIYNPSTLALTSATILDGVTISGGNANKNDSPYCEGGGMCNDHCSPTLNNLTFRYNVASRNGGGIYNYYSSPMLSNTIFVKNLVSSNNGGGMSNNNSSPNLVNVVFNNNRANKGGGLDNFFSSPVLTNVTISGNAASSNSQGQGGGIYNYASSSPVLKNCIVYGNTAKTNEGNEIYIEAGTVTLKYCCYGNGSGDVSGGTTFTFTPDENCITADPKIVDAAGGDCRLYGNSPCVDDGFDDYNTKTTDIRGAGFGRKLLKTDHTQNGTIDMGAYEYMEGTDLMEPGFVIYVKTAENGGDDTHDGETWNTAVATLQKALDKAVSGKQIWIAKGTYKPSSAYSLTVDGNRDFHFEMKEGVEIYGGFAGTEDPKTFDLNNRDLTNNKTILSGDIGIEGNNSDNCYHVFYHPNGTGLSNAAVLDGVTITGGNANTNGVAPHMYGGGMYNNNCSPSLRNVVISGNSADKGGGMYNYNASSPTLVNVLISDNTADYGGGMYNDTSSPTLTNVTISSNSATTYGGGIYNNKISFTLNNCIVWGNKSVSRGHEIYNQEGSVNLNYSCYGNASRDVDGTVTPDAHCTTGNPMFADAR